MTIEVVHDPHEYRSGDPRPEWEIVADCTTTYAPTDSTPLSGLPNTAVYFSLERYLAFPQTWEMLPDIIKSALIARDMFGWSRFAILVSYDDEGRQDSDPWARGCDSSGAFDDIPRYSADLGWAWYLLSKVMRTGIFSTREAFCAALETFVRTSAREHYHQYAATLPFVRILHELQPEHIARACVAAMGYDLMDMSEPKAYERRGAWIGSMRAEKE